MILGVLENLITRSTRLLGEGFAGSKTKLAVVLETVLTESELGKYCRKKGLYSEQVKGWKEES